MARNQAVPVGMRDSLIESTTIRAFALAIMVTIAACGDAHTPTGPTPRSTPSFAAAGGSLVKSIVGLEPLLDAALNESDAFGVSDFGVVVGQSSTAASGVHGVIWDGSTIPQDLGSLGGQSSATAIAPNGSAIVGYSGLAGGGQSAVRWVRVNGAWVIDALFQPATVSTCFATNVASNGSIVGGCIIGNDVHAILWQNGIATDFGVGSAIDINANNQILVNRPTGSPEILDLRTNPVTVTQLGKVDNLLTQGTGLNDAGEVSVSVFGATVDDRRPYVWTSRKRFAALPTIGGGMLTSGINNAGNVIGFTTAGGASTARSVYWSKSKAYELGVLPSYAGAIARGINASGQIVGSSYLTTANIRATVWTLK